MIAFRTRVQKGEKERIGFSSMLLGAVLLGVVGYLAFSDWRIYRTRAALQQRLGILQDEIQNLEQRNAELEKLLAKTGTEEYAEKTARERLNLKKTGEEVVVVVPPEQKEEEQPQNQNLLQKIINKILRSRD